MNIFGLGTPELLLILLVILIFFGKDKLPELARGIGKAAKELKQGLTLSEKDEQSSQPEKAETTTTKES